MALPNLDDLKENLPKLALGAAVVAAAAAKDKLPEIAEAAKEKLPEMATVAKEKLPELADAAKEKLPELADAAKEKLPELADAAKEKLPELADAAKEKLPDFLTRSTEETVYSGIDTLPKGEADDTVTEGCLVLEGGAFRGLYTQGVCDALMEEGINFQTTVGISAGAMTGMGYVAGQIGWCADINLRYRHDSSYIGIDAMKNDRGITGFSYLFNDIFNMHGFNEERFNRQDRRFVCAATNLKTGKAEFFERGKCSDIQKAVQASATVPYVSQPVEIDGTPYLDGGCVLNIPYHWAKREGFKKIIVVKTRDRDFRADPEAHQNLNTLLYREYPELLKEMKYSHVRYDCLLDEIDTDEVAGWTFVIAPKEPVEVSRFEGDMEKLGELYWKGYNEMKEQIPALREYLRT